MRKIKQIFDGDYCCEELAPCAKPKVSVAMHPKEAASGRFCR